MSSRFKAGDVVYYTGPTVGTLNPHTLVEVVGPAIGTDVWSVRVTGYYNTTTYTVKESYLSAGDPYVGDYYPVDNYLPYGHNDTDELRKKRKENGECEKCGKKREVSVFGLLDCSCSPSLPQRW